MSNLVACKECGHQVSKKAKTCPQCGVKDPGITSNDHAKGCLGIVGIVFVVFLFNAWQDASMTPENKAKQKELDLKKTCEDDIGAIQEAKYLVSKKLRSPSTAEFPSYFSGEINHTYLGDCTHKIASYVDSQNGFGAIVRTPFSIILKVNPKTGIYQQVNGVVNNNKIENNPSAMIPILDEDNFISFVKKINKDYKKNILSVSKSLKSYKSSPIENYINWRNNKWDPEYQNELSFYSKVFEKNKEFIDSKGAGQLFTGFSNLYQISLAPIIDRQGNNPKLLSSTIDIMNSDSQFYRDYTKKLGIQKP